MYKKVFKRVIDLIVAFLALLILAPLIGLVTLLLYSQNKGKPFFFQERPGQFKKPFYIIKFKTMTDEKDAEGNLLPDNLRITKFGGWVRKLSIDELPQLINVLKGEMSLVGPRPLLFKYMPLYTAEQLRRHEVRPGISWTQKFALDVEYVDKVSFLMDCKILLLTVKKVLIREGINQSAERPMQPFNGTN